MYFKIKIISVSEATEHIDGRFCHIMIILNIERCLAKKY